MQNCIHGDKKFRMCGMEVVNYMKNIFQSIRLDPYYYENLNTNIFKKRFYKAIQDKELSRILGNEQSIKL